MLCAMNILGYSTGNVLLMSITPEWVSIKPITAIAFIMLSIALLHRVMNKRDVIVPLFTSLFTLALMFVSVMLYISAYMADSVNVSEPYTITDGCPSWGTIICIVILATTILRSIYHEVKFRNSMIVVGLMSVFAILGYVIDVPAMYFYYEDTSTGMSVITAIYTLAVSCVMKYLYA